MHVLETDPGVTVNFMVSLAGHWPPVVSSNTCPVVAVKIFFRCDQCLHSVDLK